MPVNTTFWSDDVSSCLWVEPSGIFEFRERFISPRSPMVNITDKQTATRDKSARNGNEVFYDVRVSYEAFSLPLKNAHMSASTMSNHIFKLRYLPSP